MCRLFVVFFSLNIHCIFLFFYIFNGLSSHRISYMPFHVIHITVNEKKKEKTWSECKKRNIDSLCVCSHTEGLISADLRENQMMFWERHMFALDCGIVVANCFYVLRRSKKKRKNCLWQLSNDKECRIENLLSLFSHHFDFILLRLTRKSNSNEIESILRYFVTLALQQYTVDTQRQKNIISKVLMVMTICECWCLCPHEIILCLFMVERPIWILKAFRIKVALSFSWRIK